LAPWPRSEGWTDDDGLGRYRHQWEFHQATGMLSVQIGTHDMGEAPCWLIELAAARGE
jgi:hypothetical protein